MRRDASKRRQLGREQELAVALVDVERLLPEAVAREQQPPALGVPQGEGEHPLERRDERVAELLVQVRDNLGVGRRAELVAAPAQPRAQPAVVVDLAVERDPDRPVLVAERLVSALDVHHGEPSSADREARHRVRVDAFVVGPPVTQQGAHRAHIAPFRVLRAPGDPTHAGPK